jgi:hypothetical protein
MLGREAGVRTRMFMLALVLASSARAAKAQRVEVAMPHLRYLAPASCPDRSFFIERMRARVDAAGARALPTASLHVVIELHGPSVRGSVQVERGGSNTLTARTAPRRLEAASCREVVEGLALIAALAVTAPNNARARVGSNPNRTATSRAGGRAKSDAAASAPAPERGDARESEAQPTSSEQQTTTEARTARDASTASEPAAAATDARAGRHAPEAKAEVEAGDSLATREPAPAEPRDEDPEDAEEEFTSPRADAGDPRVRGWSIGAGVLAVHGVGPAIQPGLQLLAAVTLDSGALDWSLRLGGRLALEHTETSTQGSAHFGLIAGLLQLCATGALGASALTLDGCAVAEPGALLASADHTQKAKSYKEVWLAAGTGIALGWRAARWLSIHAGGELLAPLRRDRMLLAGDLLHEVPPVCLRAVLSLEIPLE